MFFEIKRELGFSRSEWNALNWIDQRMYTEQLAMWKYEKAYENWKQGAAGKRGPAPKKPVFRTEEERTVSTQPQEKGELQDIGSIEGMDIQDV